jgi:hypothetical protein
VGEGQEMEKTGRNLADLCSKNEAFIARKAIGRPLIGIHIWDREYRKMGFNRDF